MSNKTGHKCAHCFKSLGVPARHKIYGYLKENDDVTVSELVGLVGLRQPTVSYHLRGMQSNGLLSSTKKGKEVYYSINENCPSYDCACVLNSVNFSADE